MTMSINRTKAKVLTADEKQGEMVRAVLKGKRFADVDLSATVFEEATCDRAQFVGVDLTGADFSGASLVEAAFLQCDMADVCFRAADVRQARFIECRGLTPMTMSMLRAQGAVVWERVVSAI
jgi:uncharacterized protein YjbI with pentapeptide repeats